MMWNPLIVSPSPRNDEEVKENLLTIPHDILYAKHYRLIVAMTKIYEFFMKNKQYTHLIYCPDDLVVNKTHVAELKKILDSKDYPILTGVCNVDLDEHKDYLAITRNLPHPAKHLPNQLGWRWYHWFHKSEVSGVIRVNHSGNACAIIRRDVLNKLKFADDASFNPEEDPNEAGSVDVMWSNSCAIAKIPIVVNTDVRMLHKRHFGKIDIELGDSYMEFLRWDEKEQTHVNQNA